MSGAVFVEFIQAWSPGSWLYPETFVFLAAILVGGAANNWGVMVGTLLVPVGFLEATRFLPQIFYNGFIAATQWVCLALLSLIFVCFRPSGLFHENPGRSPPKRVSQPAPAASPMGIE